MFGRSEAVRRHDRGILAPHTRAKHRVLRSYLRAWFPIMARLKRAGTIRYIDGYCGPGRYGDQPGSPLIALQAAIEAHQRNPSKPHIFDFVDKDPKCTKQLEKALKGMELPSRFEVRVHTGDFESFLPELLSTLQDGHAVFAFLDPFGFDVKPEVVAQLLPRKTKMREVLLYFPIGAAHRFRSHPYLKAIMEAWGIDAGGRDLEDIRQGCQLTLGKFVEYILTFSMLDRRRRPIYDLFFVTDSLKGFMKMKEAMWGVDRAGISVTRTPTTLHSCGCLNLNRPRSCGLELRRCSEADEYLPRLFSPL